MATSRLAKIVAMPLLALLCSTLGGCGGIGWLAAQFAPPKKVEPVYRMPSNKKILVFVDDLLAEVRYQPIKSELAERISERLSQHKVAASTIPYDQLAAMMTATSDFRRLSISEIGAKLGADLVLYVHIDKFSLKDDESGPLWRGELHTTVRVVDIKGGRLWPEDKPEGYPVPAVDLPPEESSSPNHGTELSRILADRMAENVARLFYEHRVPASEFYK
ncbi:MAG: hypothetical protein WC869_06665 [Phycisphaerae bacterium]